MSSVTIVIPIYNRASYLPRLFRSLSAVDYEDLEVLLVDNGSSDSSLAQCRTYAQDAPMYVRVLQEPRTGPTMHGTLVLTSARLSGFISLIATMSLRHHS